jgi:two-component system, sensor histidine kinase and response regulator
MDDDQVFRTLVQHSYDIITVIALDGTRQYISPSVESLLGYAQQDLIGRPGLALIHPDDLHIVRQAMDEVVSHPGNHPTVRLRLLRKDGVWRIFEAVATNALDRPGIDGVIFNSRDVTEQVRTILALERSRATFRASIEAALDAIIFMNAEGLIQEFNPAAEATFDYRRADVMGKPLGETIIPPESREAHYAGLARFLETQEGPILNQRVQIQAMRADGQTFPAELTAVPIQLAGEPTIFAGFVRDISQEVALHDKLRRNNERFRKLIENSSDIISVLDRDNRRIFTSPAVEHILGYRPEELIGGSAILLTHPEDRERGQKFFEQLRAYPGRRATIEVRLQHQDGAWRWFEVIGINRLDDPSIEGIVTTGRDITDRKAIEDERSELLKSRQEYARKLERLAAMRADFTAMVAHELTAPIATIRRVAELLASSADSPLHQRIATIADQEAEQLLSLVEDIQAISRMEWDGFSVSLQPIQVDVLVARCQEFIATIDHQHLFEWPGPTGLCVLADRARIEQVLRNLLSNAVKHTPAHTSIAVGAVLAEGRVRIEIRDTGPGISPTDHQTIFEKFGRSPATQARQIAGAGLGLYLSQQIVRAHNSELMVESAPNQGATFWFELPLASE